MELLDKGIAYTSHVVERGNDGVLESTFLDLKKYGNIYYFYVFLGIGVRIEERKVSESKTPRKGESLHYKLMYFF